MRTDLELLLRGYADTVGREIAKKYVSRRPNIPTVSAANVLFVSHIRRLASQRLDASTPTVPEFVSDTSTLPLSEFGMQAYDVLRKEESTLDDPLVVPPNQFTKADRDRLLEMMLADPAVVTQLCARRRPSRRHASRTGSPPPEPGEEELPPPVTGGPPMDGIESG